MWFAANSKAQPCKIGGRSRGEDLGGSVPFFFFLPFFSSTTSKAKEGPLSSPCVPNTHTMDSAHHSRCRPEACNDEVGGQGHRDIDSAPPLPSPDLKHLRARTAEAELREGEGGTGRRSTFLWLLIRHAVCNAQVRTRSVCSGRNALLVPQTGQESPFS